MHLYASFYNNSTLQYTPSVSYKFFFFIFLYYYKFYIVFPTNTFQINIHIFHFFYISLNYRHSCLNIFFLSPSYHIICIIFIIITYFNFYKKIRRSLYGNGEEIIQASQDIFSVFGSDFVFFVTIFLFLGVVLSLSSLFFDSKT